MRRETFEHKRFKLDAKADQYLVTLNENLWSIRGGIKYSRPEGHDFFIETPLVWYTGNRLVGDLAYDVRMTW